MSVSPLSDIVLDVAKAAIPKRYQAAVAKLSTAASPPFSEALGVAQASPAVTSTRSADVETILTRLRSAGPSLATRKPGGPGQDFEAFVLQTFIESMLPKDAAAVFGKGNAGAIWKSMLAEQLGAQIARAGGIGIAQAVQANRHPSGTGGGASRPDAA
ncbi:rod-binding protein [Methylobacterium sp. 1030]|uniref:rod-binding protein n=1 Tax=Methylobacterium sp. 1030 TaxID=3156404 RepID=UPI0033968AB1